VCENVQKRWTILLVTVIWAMVWKVQVLQDLKFALPTSRGAQCDVVRVPTLLKHTR